MSDIIEELEGFAPSCTFRRLDSAVVHRAIAEIKRLRKVTSSTRTLEGTIGTQREDIGQLRGLLSERDAEIERLKAPLG